MEPPGNVAWEALSSAMYILSHVNLSRVNNRRYLLHSFSQLAIFYGLYKVRNTCSFFGGVQISLFLGFTDVLLVANSFVSKPIGNLRNGDATFASQLFLGFFARVGIAQM